MTVGMIEKLNIEDRRREVAKLPGWRDVDGRDAICKSFRLRDFKEAWAFMTQIALKAEQMDHHPEWSNVYANVEITLTTHDCDGVSRRDIVLAEFINRLEARICGD